MKIELSDEVIRKLGDAWEDPTAGLRLEADFEPSGSGPLCGAVAIEMTPQEVEILKDRMRPRGEPLPLHAPARHDLPLLFRELKRGRPANAQTLLDSIADITERGAWLLGDAYQIVGICPPDQTPTALGLDQRKADA